MILEKIHRQYDKSDWEYTTYIISYAFVLKKTKKKKKKKNVNTVQEDKLNRHQDEVE